MFWIFTTCKQYAASDKVAFDGCRMLFVRKIILNKEYNAVKMSSSNPGNNYG